MSIAPIVSTLHLRNSASVGRYRVSLPIALGKLLLLIGLCYCWGVAHAVSCYAVHAPTLVFSPYHPIGSEPQDIESLIDFSCAPAFQGNQLRAMITLQDSPQGSAFQLRNEVGDTLRYALFVDPARSIPLTRSTLIPVRDANPGTKTFSIVLYGRIFANQRTAGVGHYRGFIHLSVSY